MRVAVFLMAAALLGGCASSALDETAVPTLHQGTIAAETQSDTLFRDINSRSRDADAARVLLQAEQPGRSLPTLSEADFTPLIEPQTRAQWTAVFEALKSYTGALVRLTDPKLASATDAGLVAVGNQMTRLGASADKVGPFAGVVGAIGGTLVSAAAERDALAVMRRVDPDFRALTTAMADALGKDDSDGLRGTVKDLWNRNRLQVLQNRYGEIPRGPEGTAARTELLEAWLAGAGARDADLADLARLRSALLALGEAHQAAAAGDKASTRIWVDRIEALLDEVSTRTKAKE